MSPAWLTDLVLGDHFVGAGYGAAAVAGTPSITVPMGESHGLPMGMVFMGPAWSEAKLLSVGYAYEQRSKLRRAPTFAPTVTLGKTALPSSKASAMPVWTSAEPATGSTATKPAAASTKK